jgi:hypothetical protein
VFSFDGDFHEVVAGDPFRYQVNGFSTAESAQVALASLLRGETETDRMFMSALASEPGSSNSPPPP